MKRYYVQLVETLGNTVEGIVVTNLSIKNLRKAIRRSFNLYYQDENINQCLKIENVTGLENYRNAPLINLNN